MQQVSGTIFDNVYPRKGMKTPVRTGDRPDTVADDLHREAVLPR